MTRLLVGVCIVLCVLGVMDAQAHTDTNLIMEVTGNQRARIVKEMQDNWNDLARGTGALTNGLTVIGNVTVTGTVTATSVDAGSLTDVTLADGQILDSADTTNVTLTGAERALSTFQITAGGSTNVAGDDISLDIKGRDLWGTSTVYFAIDLDMTDTDSGSQDGTAVLKIPVAGTETARFTMNAGGVQFEAGDIVIAGGTYTGTTLVKTNIINTTFTSITTWVDGLFISQTTDP